MLNICWFSTGRDEEAFKLLVDVVHATKTKKIDGRISLCFFNRDPEESIYSQRMVEFAKTEGIPCEILSTREFLFKKGLSLKEGRRLFDEEVLKIIENYRFDLIFLAGYMLIVSEVLFDRFTILNLHPSLPGRHKGKWEDVIKKVIENGETTFGAMIHIVDGTLDGGPCVTFCKSEVSENEVLSLYEGAKRKEKEAFEKLFWLIREREFRLETPLIIETLSLLSKGKIRILGKKVYFEGKEIQGGIDITDLIVYGEGKEWRDSST
ncbi:MAG: hypothetical protein NZ583_00125 [Desulfobacterota bacterium]|nr:hypothetical protein [Thermodesulfobacteriota bacterium]MDW8001120.1 formyltransferase family protein [Deltaproteobacteria bacterium]